MKKNYTVLGIHCGHDSGAAIVQNGKVLAAINEERILNIKHYNGFPEKSFLEVLKISNVDPSEIDLVSLSGIIDIEKPPEPLKFPIYAQLYFTWNGIISNQNSSSLFHFYNNYYRRFEKLKKILSKYNINKRKIICVEHHMAHAATAYYLSPWSLDDDVLLFTADAGGDGLSSTVNIGSKGIINRIPNSESSYFDSVGHCFYGEITSHLGMVKGDHEYKVMGLAPYGNSSYCLEKIQKIIDLDPKNNLKFKNNLGVYVPLIHEELKKLLDNQRFDNIAAAAQKWFEHLFTTWVTNAIEKTGIKKIACAGGDFLNVKANKLILEMEEVDDVFFCPASGDEGLAVGAALLGYFSISDLDGKKPTKVPITDIYFGTSFSNDKIFDELKKYRLTDKSQFIDDIDDEVGELLSKSDNVIARFNGRMEWGPRGLGNRSILANASSYEVTKKINHAIKMRDFWMPFGPSILKTSMDEYLVNAKNAPYMILAFDTTEKRNDLSAAIHPYDFTCRPQTVDKYTNPSYEKLIQTFQSKTGLGGILNTSFNLHGYPIVFDPKTAIETFLNSKLDVLAIGNYLVTK